MSIVVDWISCMFTFFVLNYMVVIVGGCSFDWVDWCLVRVA